MIELEDRLLLSWDYLDALFPPQMVEQMFVRYQQALHTLVEGDWQQPPLCALPAEQQIVRQKSNDTAAPATEPAVLHQGFFEQALKHPQNIAL